MTDNEQELLEASVRRVDSFASLPVIEQTAYLTYFLTKFLGRSSVTGRMLEETRSAVKLVPGDSAKHLSVNSRGKSKRFLKRNPGYVLTRTEEQRIELSLGRPASIAASVSLRQHMSTIVAPDLRAYLAEAVGSFEHGFFRAAIVMAWCAAFSTLRDWIFTKHLAAFNAQTSTWKKPKTIGQLADLDELSERVILDTARLAGIFSSGEHKTLVHLLDQRNAYAHPSGRSVTPSVSEAFVQQIIDEVLNKYR